MLYSLTAADVIAGASYSFTNSLIQTHFKVHFGAFQAPHNSCEWHMYIQHTVCYYTDYSTT